MAAQALGLTIENYHRDGGLEEPCEDGVCGLGKTPYQPGSVGEARGGAGDSEPLRLREDGGGGESPRGSLWRQRAELQESGVLCRF